MILQDKILKQAGDYKIIKSLANSSFSTVYLCQHLLSGISYALKAIKNPNNRSRIDNEINMAKQLKHFDEVIHLKEVFYDEKKLFFVYDLAEQENLKEYILNRGTLQESEVLEIFKSLLHTIKQLHKVDIIHQNINPDNIIINEEKYYFCDFGAASFNKKQIEVIHLTTDSGFTAPEVYCGFYNKSSDIYALGCILYYVCTGEYVFNITSKDSNAYCMLAHSKLNLDFTKVKSKKIQYLLKRMLDKSHRQRASIAELEYILLNNYDDLNILQLPLDYTVEKNRTEVQIYEELSQDNISFAQNNLGLLNVQENPKKAFELYSKAAQEGLISALYNLGLCYKNAVGCSSNMEKAFDSFSKAAIHHHEKATCMLGMFYEYGVYVTKNISKSEQLYKASAYHGEKKAYKKLQSIEFLSKTKQKVNYNSYS